MRNRSMLTGLILVLAPVSFTVANEPISNIAAPGSQQNNSPRDEMLHRYLLDQARQQFDARRKAIAAIKTPDDITRRQKELLRLFSPFARRFSRRTPLNPRFVGTLQHATVIGSKKLSSRAVPTTM